MRILIPLFSKGRGGLEMYALDLADELLKRGHEVHMLTRRDTFSERRRQDRQIPGQGLRIAKYVDVMALYTLYDLVRNFEPDVVHCHKSQDIWYGSYLSWLRGDFAHIFTQHMRPGEKNDVLHRMIYSTLDQFIVISDDVREAALNNCPVDDGIVQKVYYGINVDRFDPEGSKEKRYVPEFSDEQTQKVGLVGRIDPVKRHDVFLEAARIVLESRDNVEFWIVGDTVDEKDEEYKEQLLDYIREHGLEEDVHFLGHVDDVQAVYRQLDVNCMTTDREHFGKVIQESQAMEVPVVVSNGGGAPEALDPGRTGLLFEPGNAQDLAEQIKVLLSDPERRKSMAGEGRKFMREKFSEEEHFDRIEAIYENQQEKDR